MVEENKEPAQEKKSSKSHSVVKEIRKNPWIISSFVLGILVIVMLLFGSVTGNAVSEKKAGENWIAYLNSLGYDGTIVGVKSENGMYNVTFDYDGGTASVLLTSNGKYYSYGGLVPISVETEEQDSGIPKSDKPVVELFVMAYCPYGTQAEKGIIPVIETLGDSVDFRIRYVYYAMHGEKEITENLREYCIQENEPEKFLDYMNCFLEGDGVVSSSGYITEGNDVETCLTQAGIDKTNLETCMTDSDEKFSVTANFEDKDSWLSGYYPLFDVDKDLNEKYGVGGSPTLIINGVEASSARDSASYLNVICSAFTDGNVPSVCETAELSSEAPSVYFGWDGTSSGSNSGVCN